jgi:hypothetical protein
MSAVSELEFLRKIQRLLEEGEFVATYKYALLQALADLSVEYDLAPNGRLRLPLAAIAEKFVEYYWGQSLPYAPDLAQGGVLKQNTGKQAAVVNWLVRERAEVGGSLAALRQRETRWRGLLRNVAAQVRTMPLWKLQVMGGRVEEFLYRQDHLEAGCIELQPGVQQSFRAFHGLVTNLVRGGWLMQIRRIGTNRALLGERGDIAEFLFGSERRSLKAYRAVLREHQAARCFYCGREVRQAGDADHFIPWSRYPVDLGHNFVFSHPACNHSKRDFLAHPDFLAKWREQNLDLGDRLARRFDERALLHDAERSLAIAWWAYEQGQHSHAQVWLAKDRFLRLDDGWRTALRALPRAAEARGAYRMHSADPD